MCKLCAHEHTCRTTGGTSACRCKRCLLCTQYTCACRSSVSTCMLPNLPALPAKVPKRCELQNCGYIILHLIKWWNALHIRNVRAIFKLCQQHLWWVWGTRVVMHVCNPVLVACPLTFRTSTGTYLCEPPLQKSLFALDPKGNFVVTEAVR